MPHDMPMTAEKTYRNAAAQAARNAQEAAKREAAIAYRASPEGIAAAERERVQSGIRLRSDRRYVALSVELALAEIKAKACGRFIQAI